MGARYSILGATVEQVRSVGGTEIKEARSTRIIFATLTEEQAQRLRSMGCTVSKVGGVKAAVIPPAPVAGAATYSPEQLVVAAGYEGLRSITRPPLYGEGFTVAILGTGIRETHEKINGHVVYSKNYTSSPMHDGFDHDTGVASIILAMAPLCSILNLKVLDDSGEGSEEDVVMAIDDCISLQDTQPDIAPWVINLSLGTPDTGNPDEPLRVACRAANENGIWVSAAAGNDGPNPQTVMSPACERYVFASGSTGYEPFAVSNFSSRGPTKEGLIKPDVVTFGENMVMASSQSDTATVAKSGTSFATPFTSGMALLYHEGVLKYHGVQYPGGVPPGIHPEVTWLISTEELMDTYLQGICVKPQGELAGKDNSYGYGMPFGSLISKAIIPKLDISGVLTGLVAISMFGMIVGAVK